MTPSDMLDGAQRGALPFTFEGHPEKTILLNYYRAARYSPGGDVVFVQHGMMRNGDEYRDFWIDAADAHDLLIVAPTFPDEMFPETENYNNGMVKDQSHRTTARDSWTYHVPARVVGLLVSHGVMTEGSARIFGHSAGGQFLHRMVSLVGMGPFRHVIAANAGWYSLPVLETEFPAGLGGVGLSKDDLRRLLGSDLRIMAGQDDCHSSADNLPSAPEALAQGAGRLQRARTYHAAGRAAAEALGTPFAWQLTEVPNVDHDGDAMGRAAAGLWFENVLPSARELGAGTGQINS